MPATSKSIRFQAEPGVELHGLEWESISDPESATPLILLHGGGANAHWWDHLASELTSHGPVYALDFRGHGDSSFPEQLRVGAFNDDLEALVDWLGRDDVMLVGHSMGAAVALDHASRFHSTRGIVLVDLARGSSPGTGRRARLALSLRRTYRSRQEAIERFRFLPESLHQSEALRRHVAEHSIQEEQDQRFGYKFDPRWFAMPSRPRPDLKRIECPTLLIRGEESALLSSEAGKEFVTQVEKGRFVEIANAGHHVLIDQPDPLLALLHEFLSALSDAG
jgi:pimeloyl-ACP methyl ester carboxylesterase